MPSLRDAAEWVVKRISALTRTATDADLTDSEYMAVDNASAYTRKITVASLATWILGKIKSLATSITDFRTGDVIPVDGPSGPAKMAKDDLLKETAENAEITFSNVLEPTQIKENVYLDEYGNEQSSTIINIADFNTTNMKMVRIVCRLGYLAYIWFYDSDGNRLTKYVGNYGEGINFKQNILVPQNAVKMRVSYTFLLPFFVSDWSSLLDCTKENSLTAASSIALIPTQIKEKVYLDNNGNEQYSPIVNIADYGVVGIRIASVYARIGYLAYIWFYDSDGTPISSISGNTGEGINFKQNILVPQNAVKMRVSYTFLLPFFVSDFLKANAYNISYFDNNGLVKFDEKDGCYLDVNGVVQPQASVSGIKSYLIGDAKWFYLETRIGYLAYIWFYDSDGTPISSISGNTGEGENFKMVVNIPSGAFIVRISHTMAYKIKLLSGKFADNAINSMKFGTFVGKKIVFIGDSITYGYNATNYKGYVDFIAKMTGATCVNLGVGGTCIANNTTNGLSSSRFVTRATAENLSGADLVVVFGGTNDFSYDSKAIGDLFNIETITPSDRIGDKKIVAVSDTDTFAGALHELITTIQANAPVHCKIMFITPLKRGRYSPGRPTAYESNPNGDFLQDFASAIKGVCEYYSIPVLDLYASGLNPLSSLESDFFADTLHPNDAGHKILAEIISKFIEENIILIR